MAERRPWLRQKARCRSRRGELGHGARPGRRAQQARCDACGRASQRSRLSIEREHKNPFYLSDFTLPENIRATTSLEEALKDTDFVLMVVPSHAMRDCVSDG